MKSTQFCLFLIFSTLSLGSFLHAARADVGGSEKTDAEELVRRADVAVREKRFDAAISLLMKANHLAPERQGILRRQGEVFEQLKAYGSAARALEDAAQIADKNADKGASKLHARAQSNQERALMLRISTVGPCHPETTFTIREGAELGGRARTRDAADALSRTSCEWSVPLDTGSGRSYRLEAERPGHLLVIRRIPADGPGDRTEVIEFRRFIEEVPPPPDDVPTGVKAARRSSLPPPVSDPRINYRTVGYAALVGSGAALAIGMSISFSTQKDDGVQVVGNAMLGTSAALALPGFLLVLLNLEPTPTPPTMTRLRLSPVVTPGGLWIQGSF